MENTCANESVHEATNPSSTSEFIFSSNFKRYWVFPVAEWWKGSKVGGME
jgi:hypothetical protein